MEFDECIEAHAGRVAMAFLAVKDCCPGCAAAFPARVKESFLAGRRVQCLGCGFDGNWRAGTMLFRAGISNSHFLLLFGKFGLPDDIAGIAGALGVSTPTVRQWRHRIMDRSSAE